MLAVGGALFTTVAGGKDVGTGQVEYTLNSAPCSRAYTETKSVSPARTSVPANTDTLSEPRADAAAVVGSPLPAASSVSTSKVPAPKPAVRLLVGANATVPLKYGPKARAALSVPSATTDRVTEPSPPVTPSICGRTVFSRVVQPVYSPIGIVSATLCSTVAEPVESEVVSEFPLQPKQTTASAAVRATRGAQIQLMRSQQQLPCLR